MDSKSVLEQVRSGAMSVEEAERFFQHKAYEDLGYAKLDTYREIRSGFPEVIYCSNKPDEFLLSIYQRLFAEHGEVYGTRASAEQYELVRKVLPQIQYDAVARQSAAKRLPARREIAQLAREQPGLQQAVERAAERLLLRAGAARDGAVVAQEHDGLGGDIVRRAGKLGVDEAEVAVGRGKAHAGF